MAGSASHSLVNYRLIGHICGVLLLVLAAAMAVPAVVSAIYGDGALRAFIISEAAVVAAGSLLTFLVGHRHSNDLQGRESFWITAVAWLLIPLAGALPFLLSDGMGGTVDALFESVSGFTTTGASVLASPEQLPLSLLLWRHITQWLGGLGLMLIIIASHRNLKVGSLKLYDAEFSGTVQRKLHPKISTSVAYMWQVYVLLTIVLFVVLLICGNGLRNSFCLALSTISTGGFLSSSYALSTATPATLTAIGVFMTVSGINVALIYNLIHGRIRLVGRDEEFRAFGMFFLISSVVCSVAFAVAGNGLASSVGYSLFHTASTLSTCGFCIDSSLQWPPVVGVVTFLLIIAGASSGSTGGGIKLKRLMILRRYVSNYISRMLHPNVVFSVRLNGLSLSSEYVGKVFAFMFLYLLFIIVGGGVLTVCGCDIPSAICVAAANMANLGPTPLINNLSPEFSYAALPVVGKVTLMVLMVAGRIEIFALLALFSPAYWRKR